jgi:hypothetical protein
MRARDEPVRGRRGRPGCRQPVGGGGDAACHHRRPLNPSIHARGQGATPNPGQTDRSLVTRSSPACGNNNNATPTRWVRRLGCDPVPCKACWLLTAHGLRSAIGEPPPQSSPVAVVADFTATGTAWWPVQIKARRVSEDRFKGLFGCARKKWCVPGLLAADCDQRPKKLLKSAFALIFFVHFQLETDRR